MLITSHLLFCSCLGFYILFYFMMLLLPICFRFHEVTKVINYLWQPLDIKSYATAKFGAYPDIYSNTQSRLNKDFLILIPDKYYKTVKNTCLH
jgi:hypothetical protein